MLCRCGVLCRCAMLCANVLCWIGMIVPAGQYVACFASQSTYVVFEHAVLAAVLDV